MKLSGLTIVAPRFPSRRATYAPAKPPPSTSVPPLASRRAITAFALTAVGRRRAGDPLRSRQRRVRLRRSDRRRDRGLGEPTRALRDQNGGACRAGVAPQRWRESSRRLPSPPSPVGARALAQPVPRPRAASPARSPHVRRARSKLVERDDLSSRGGALAFANPPH